MPAKFIPFFRRLYHSPLPRLATVMLFALAMSSLAFCGEIHEVAASGDLEKVKTLLNNDPNLVSSVDIFGKTPLHMAAQNGHKDVAELLLAHGADVNAHSPSSVVWLEPDRTGHLRAGLTNGEVIQIQYIGGPTGNVFSDFWSWNSAGTPLHEAAKTGSKDVADLLLAHGADVNAKDNFGGTPLHRAASYDHKDVAELLLANKADINAKDNNGETPLHRAASNGHKDVAELLLANKADVNAKDSYGNTPLHWAAGEGHKDMAELLLAHGADVNAKGKKGRTPLHWAASNGHKDVAELLRQHGGRK